MTHRIALVALALLGCSDERPEPAAPVTPTAPEPVVHTLYLDENGDPSLYHRSDHEALEGVLGVDAYRGVVRLGAVTAASKPFMGSAPTRISEDAFRRIIRSWEMTPEAMRGGVQPKHIPPPAFPDTAQRIILGQVDVGSTRHHVTFGSDLGGTR